MEMFTVCTSLSSQHCKQNSNRDWLIAKKKNQNCCYFHFDPFTEDCNNAIDKEIDLSNFGVHCVLQGILHW